MERGWNIAASAETQRLSRTQPIYDGLYRTVDLILPNCMKRKKSLKVWLIHPPLSPHCSHLCANVELIIKGSDGRRRGPNPAQPLPPPAQARTARRSGRPLTVMQENTNSRPIKASYSGLCSQARHCPAM